MRVWNRIFYAFDDTMSCWGVAEGLGEVARNLPSMRPKILALLRKFRDDEASCQGFIWAVCRIGQIDRELVDDFIPDCSLRAMFLPSMWKKANFARRAAACTSPGAACRGMKKTPPLSSSSRSFSASSGMAVPHFVIDAPGGGGKIPLLPDNYLVHLDEDGAVLRNYENKTFHYPQPKTDGRRELPMVGVGSPVDEVEEAYAACGDSDPDRDGYAMWGNSCGGDADEL